VGLAVSVVVFLPLGLVAEHLGFRHWWQTLAILTALLVVVVVVAAVYAWSPSGPTIDWPVLLIWASLGLYLVGGFFVYLCSIGICRRMFP
ncbi:MAG TPA: hypothetical protein VK633_13945, partial [Verrucomicrobiae bacterium]|nr:hypothetical protein [Verrucomicrobiae bacterium]